VAAYIKGLDEQQFITKFPGKTFLGPTLPKRENLSLNPHLRYRL